MLLNQNPQVDGIHPTLLHRTLVAVMVTLALNLLVLDLPNLLVLAPPDPLETMDDESLPLAPTSNLPLVPILERRLHGNIIEGVAAPSMSLVGLSCLVLKAYPRFPLSLTNKVTLDPSLRSSITSQERSNSSTTIPKSKPSSPMSNTLST